MARGLASHIQLMHMPMTFNGLVAENTNRCNARCRMCYQSSGPKGSDLWGAASLTVEELERVVRESAAIETLLPRFHLSGGEAFLNVEGCVHLFGVARTSGFLDITSVTNAFWARHRSRAFDVVRRSREAGLTGLEISWDVWHLPFVPPEAINHCLDACHANDVEANLRVLTTRAHPVAEALSYLDPRSVERANRITSGPVFASGRAGREIAREDFYVSRTSLEDSCHSTLNLTVNSFGNVYPCCAGIDQTDNYVIGSIKRQSIVDVAEAISSSPVIRTLVFQGIGAIRDIVEARGVQVGQDYNSICHLCWSIFSRRECVEAVKDHFFERQRQAIDEVLSLLGDVGVEGRETGDHTAS